MSRPFTLAGVLLISLCLAGTAKSQQEAAAASSPTQSQTSAPPEAPAQNSAKPKPKKVWTNENLGDAGGTISVVGDSRNTSKTPPKTPSGGKPVDPRVLASLRQQLQKLQSQLAVVDRQLSDLKDFGKGDSKHAGGLQQDTWQYNSSSVEEQIRNLQDKKAKIQASIDNLLDAARKSGIEPGQLR